MNSKLNALGCIQHKDTLEDEASKALGQKVVHAEEQGNIVAAHVVERSAMPAMVKLADGTTVPMLDNSKQRKSRLKMIERCIKEGRPIPVTPEAIAKEEARLAERRKQNKKHKHNKRK